MKLLSRFAVAALIGFSVSALIALASYFLGLWPGRDSTLLRTIVYYSCPFALLLGVVAVVLPRRSTMQKSSLLVAVVLGTILGFASTYYVFRFSLPIHRWAFLMLSCWVPSGISAMLVAAFGKRLSVFTGIAGLCLAAIFLHEPIFNAYAHNQQLTVAFITPVDASTAQLAANPDALGFVTDAETQTAKDEVIQHIRALGYGEEFRVLSLTKQGKGKKALAIVVVRTRINQDVVLPEPDSSTVVYLQQSDKWEKKPPEVPTLRRGIKIMAPSETDDSLAYFTIWYAPGFGLQGRIMEKVSDLPR
ncbi:MAG: hypothetical protein ABSG77_10020 [Candidatus Acidiferrum sp.]